MALSLSWASLPLLVTAGLTMLLALLLLYLDFQKRANRAFALVLLLRGAALFVILFRNVSTSPAEYQFFQRLAPYFALTQVPAILYFLAVYPRPRAWLSKTRFAGWLFLGGALALELLYAMNHSLYWSWAPGRVPTSSPLSAGGILVGGYHYTGFGPLVLIGSLSAAATCFAALVLARDYLRERPGGARYSLVLIIAGLVLSGLFSGVQLLFTLLGALSEPSYPWLPWGWTFVVLPALTLPLAIATVVLIFLGSRRTANQRDDWEAKRLLILSPLPVACGVVLGLMGSLNGDPRASFTLGIWRLVMPVLVTYALLRYHLFDLDLKVRITIHYGSMAALFAFAVFVGSETAEGLLANYANAGWFGSIGAAMLMTLAIKPVERWAQRLSHRAMPSTKPFHQLSEKERRTLYHDQFAMALQDGRLTDKERRMLAQLQRKLGIAQATASDFTEKPSRNRSPVG
jgi:hypothetical protein